jgi:hypothetical protein
MSEMGAKDAFALEPDSLGNTLRRDVVRIGDEIDPLDLEIVERMPGEKS